MKRKACNSALPAAIDLKYSLHQILYFTLNRQGLIHRISAVRSSLFPLHGTLHTTPHLSLSARVENYHANHLSDYLNRSEGQLLSYVLMRCMRGTLHVIPASKFDTVTAIYNRLDSSAAHARLSQFALTNQEVSHWHTEIRRKLLTGGPLSSAALSNSFKAKPTQAAAGTDEKGKNKDRNASSRESQYSVMTHTSQANGALSQTNVGIILHHMLQTSQLLYGLASKTGDNSPKAIGSKSSKTKASTNAANHVSEKWKKNTRAYGYATLVKSDHEDGVHDISSKSKTAPPTHHIAIETETHDAPRRKLSEESALRSLMLWYFDLYSPASLADFTWWSSRGVRESRALLQSLLQEGKLVQIVVAGMPQDLFILSSLQEELIQVTGGPSEGGKHNSCSNTLVGVRFLPYEDALIKAYKETRYRFFPVQEHVDSDSSRNSGSTNDNPECIYIADEAIEECAMWKGEAMPTIWMDGRIIGGWKWNNSQNPSLRLYFPPPKQEKFSDLTESSIGSLARKRAKVTATTATNATKTNLDNNAVPVVPELIKARLQPELKILCSMLGIDVAEVTYTNGCVR